MAIPTVIAVMESADFEPYYAGEAYITVTMRVEKFSAVYPGVYELKPLEEPKPEWSRTKHPLASSSPSTRG